MVAVSRFSRIHWSNGPNFMEATAQIQSTFAQNGIGMAFVADWGLLICGSNNWFPGARCVFDTCSFFTIIGVPFIGFALKRGSFKSVDIRMDDCSGFG